MRPEDLKFRPVIERHLDGRPIALLSARTDMHYVSIHNVVSGRKLMTMRTLFKIAEALDARPSDILREAEDEIIKGAI